MAGNDLLIGERENAIARGDYILSQFGRDGADGEPLLPVAERAKFTSSGRRWTRSWS
jgi:hypothetical protein